LANPDSIPDRALEQALALLDSVPLLDGHNDLPYVIRNSATASGNVRKYGLRQRLDVGDTDIPRLREGKVGTQIWAAFVPSESGQPARETLEQIDVVLQLNEAHPDVFLPVLCADDIDRARQQGKIGSLLAIEGGVGLENSLAPLRVWRAAGARLMTLCHNGTLDWVDSATDVARHGGLTVFGRAVVRELNRLGMVVDCAHVSADVMHQVLDVSTAPIVFSHSNARTLCDNPRNIPDDVLDRLRANGGMAMATFIPDFVSEEVRLWMLPVRRQIAANFGASRVDIINAYEREHGRRPNATLRQVADHIEYFAAKLGRDRVGIGSDFFGVPTTAIGLEDVTRFPYLIAEMFRRGWSEADVAGLASRNFVSLFRNVEQEGQRLRALRGPEVGTVDSFANPDS
jgi:membrane dipeptidase